VSKLAAGFTPAVFWFGVVASLLNSECPQQDRADESEHGAYGEHVQSQGKVHGSASLVDVRTSLAESAGLPKCLAHCASEIRMPGHARREWRRQTLDRAPQLIAVPINAAVQ
jgi:hypothetical protein